jgi:hypothetical protein
MFSDLSEYYLEVRIMKLQSSGMCSVVKEDISSKTTWYHITEDHNLNMHCCENPKSPKVSKRYKETSKK